MRLNLLRRPVVAGLALLAVYVAVSFANDTRGYLGVDTGVKVASLRAMERHHGLNPDLGYWAERWDPSGKVAGALTHHGGKWVGVTTVPALYLEYPLFRVGGYRLALLVPMLAAVATAFAARALARRLGADKSWSWAAFWVIGLGSPVAIYALDIWEHSLGVALMAWGIVLLLDVLEGAGSWRGLVIGVLFGTAAALRTEALIYGAVATAVVCLALLLWRRRVVAPLVLGVTALIGLGAPLLANQALEQATIGTSVRSTRAEGSAVAAVTGHARSDTPATRFDEATITSVGLTADNSHTSYLVGAALLALLAYGALRAASGEMLLAAGSLGAAALLYAFRFVQPDGPGFIPGLVAAAPLAAVGLARPGRGVVRWIVVAIALLALPLVWRLQYLGGGAPQWGGRYVLVSGLLLGVAGVVALPGLARWARLVLVGLALGVTAFGLTWLSIRSHDIARAWVALDGRPEPVLVSDIGYFEREGGWFYGEHHLLAAGNALLRQHAADVVAAAGYHSFGLVAIDSRRYRTPPITGFTERSIARLRLFTGLDLRVTTYVRSG